VGLERDPLRLVGKIEELLEKKSSDSSLETENTAVGIVTMATWHPICVNVGTNFADKRLSLSRYSLLADSGYGI
jgi:hypothetical protein